MFLLLLSSGCELCMFWPLCLLPCSHGSRRLLQGSCSGNQRSPSCTSMLIDGLAFCLTLSPFHALTAQRNAAESRLQVLVSSSITSLLPILKLLTSDYLSMRLTSKPRPNNGYESQNLEAKGRHLSVLRAHSNILTTQKSTEDIPTSV